MGMFDDIKYRMDCPMCGRELHGFQSKDGGCGLQTLTPRDLAKQANPGLGYGVTFYSGCKHCGTWVDIKFRHHDPDGASS